MDRIYRYRRDRINMATFADAKRRQEDIKNKERKEREINFRDKKYNTIILLILNEINKRNISLEDNEFNEKIDDIIRVLVSHKSLKRFAFDSIEEIRYAVIRRMKQEKSKEEGPAIGE